VLLNPETLTMFHVPAHKNTQNPPAQFRPSIRTDIRVRPLLNGWKHLWIAELVEEGKVVWADCYGFGATPEQARSELLAVLAD
jgi:hypothetical protein